MVNVLGELAVVVALLVMFSELLPMVDVLGELAVVVTSSVVAVLAMVRFGLRRIGIVSVTPS